MISFVKDVFNRHVTLITLGAILGSVVGIPLNIALAIIVGAVLGSALAVVDAD